MLTLLTFKLASLMTATVISAAAVVGWRYRKRGRHIQLSGVPFRRLFTLAHEAVRAAEQHYNEAPDNAASGQQKLVYARDRLREQLMRAGISIDRQGAEGMIEAYIHCRKNQVAIDAARPAGEQANEVLPVEERGLPWTS